MLREAKEFAFSASMSADTLRSVLHPGPDPPNVFSVVLIECDEDAVFKRLGSCDVDVQDLTITWHTETET